MRQGELGWWTLTRSGAHGLRTIRYWRSQGCAKMMPLFECMHVPDAFPVPVKCKLVRPSFASGEFRATFQQ